MELSEKLRELLTEKEMSYAELAERADVPLETVRNIYYGKVKDPKARTLFNISRVLNVSVNYLFGEGIMSDEEEALLLNYRKCGKHGKSVVMLIAQYEAALTASEKHKDGKHRIPCVVPVGDVYDGLEFNCSEVVDAYTSNPKAYLAVEFTNNNFAPTYCKGDRVLIEDRFPKNGERALFTKDCMLYCRTYIEENGGYTLKCLNRLGHDFHYKRMDTVECIGTCIGIIRED